MVVKVHVPRHLGPIPNGHFGFAENFAAMFFAVLGLGVDVHIMKETAVQPKYASTVVGGVFALRALLSFLLFAAMGAVLLVTGRSGEILLTALVFGVTNILIVTNATLGAVLQAVSRVGAPSVANVVTKVVFAAGILVGVHYDVPLPILALPALAGELLRTLILAPAAKSGADLRYRIEVPAVRKILIDSIPYFVNGLALGVLSSLGMSVLGYLRTDERELGWFGSVQNAAYLCMLLSPLLFWVVMPLLARAHARSREEGMLVFRRCLEALVVTIIPITVILSCSSEYLIRLAFGPKFAPAAAGLSVLSLVFVLTYMNMMFAQNLIILRRGWSVTLISVGAVFVTSALMLGFVPLGRHLIGEGGECAGAAAAVIGGEACSLLAMVTRFREFPLDGRNIRVLVKSLALAGLVLIVDRQLHRMGFGAVRLAGDAVLYVVTALAIRIVRLDDVRNVIRLVRSRDKDAPATVAAEVPS
jgi:O-antigen/teichoic acid export membrane protein